MLPKAQKKQKNVRLILCLKQTAGALINVAKTVTRHYINDMFHGLQDIVKVFRAKFHAKKKSCNSKLSKLREAPFGDVSDQNIAVQNLESTLKTLDQGEKDYKSALFAVSTQNHPFTGVSMPQSSAALEEKLNNIHISTNTFY